MEVSVLLNTGSVRTWGICHTKYLCGGDSRAYERVVSDKPYGPNISVIKLECIGYVRKDWGDLWKET